MVSLWCISWRSNGNTPMTYKENTTWFHNVEIRTRRVDSTDNRADTERPDGGIEGIDLDVLSEALRYILRRGLSTAKLSLDVEDPTLTCGGEW